jgi:hypothetical protein
MMNLMCNKCCSFPSISQKLLADATAVKFPLEELSDKCENLMEFSAAPTVRDTTVLLQSQYSILISGIQVLDFSLIVFICNFHLM